MNDRFTPRLYGMSDSGNCYKPELLLSLTGGDWEWVEVDLLKGESRTPEFVEKNLNGRVPVLEYDEGEFLPESNAILYYLGAFTTLWPADRLAQAEVLQWMFFEQYSHEPYLATSRFWRFVLKQPDEFADKLEERRPGALAALEVMDKHLATRRWFVNDTPTLADIALYAYTHVADEGGFDLEPYPAVSRWLAQVADLPGYRPMRRLGS